MGTGCFITSLGRWDLTVALPDASPGTRASVVQVLDAFAALLRRMTWGRMWLGNVSLVVTPDGLSSADIVFLNDAGADAPPGGLGRPGQFIQLDLAAPAAPAERAAKLMHEFGHYAFGLGDEYHEEAATGGGGSEVADCQCIMADLNVLQFCSSDHTRAAANTQNLAHRGASCRTVMARRYPVLALRAKAAATPSPADTVTYFDVQPDATTVLTYCTDAAPEIVRAVDAIVAVWTPVSIATRGRLMTPALRFADPMQAIFSSFALFDWNRRHASQALVLVGFPSSKAPMAELVEALAHGKGVPVHAVSPREPNAPLRDFALESGGACEVVVRTGSEAEVDLRLRLLCRLAHCVDGFGLGLLRRATLIPASPIRQVLRVEANAHVALLAVCLPSGASVEVDIVDPAGQPVTTQTTDDGSIVWALVVAPIPGDWTASVVTKSGGVPIGFAGLIHNACIRIFAERPLSAYRTGQRIHLTATLVAPAAQAQIVAVPAVLPLRPPPSASPPSSDWGDGPIASASEFTTAQLQTTAQWQGYADCRIDYRIAQAGVEPVIRVLPFQLRVVDGAQGAVRRRRR